MAALRHAHDHGWRVQLAAGASQVWTFGPYTMAVDFAVEQRPGHPGSSAPHLELSCQPTAIRLSSFMATIAGNRGGCAAANQWRGLACVITAYRPGYVSGECDGGLWFADVRTARVGARERLSACKVANTKAGAWTAQRAFRYASAGDIKGRAATLPTGRSDQPGRRIVA